MRCSPCWVIASLATGVLAFFPYEISIDSTISSDSTIETVQRRFLPYVLQPLDSDDSPSTPPLTLDIRKIPVRRDDTYAIVEADTPTLSMSAPLDQDGVDFSYFAVVEVGSQKEEMWLVLDTGSPSSWVFGTDCTSSVCEKHHRYDSDNSTTYDSNSSTISVAYGSGSIKGKLGQDTFSIADMDVKFSFGSGTSATSAFASYPIDGILGLGQSMTAGWTIPSFMDTVASEGYLKSNIVGFSLSRAADNAKNGEVNFGQVDTTKFVGEISYTSIDSDIWSIPVDDVYVNGKACGFSSKSATIDTGTTYILIPPDDAKTVFSHISGSSESGEQFIIPCDTNVTLELEFSGVKYSISPKDYIGSKSGSGCVSTILGYQYSGVNQWLVGDVFLKNVYAVFDFDNNKVGFGAKTSSSSSSSSNETSSSSDTTTSTDAATTSSTSVDDISTNAAATGTTSADDIPTTSSTDTPLGNAILTTNSASHLSLGAFPTLAVIMCMLFL
ncbi:hypothetical protein N7495_000521 [Penicillium taxi]|uniref:uncharacterized protein n=1 Tax=Penicillium taxi TaxID=168475 RepID=UPI002544F831|nr:uncharacterized protein N7495_000521 [Penicillium taxi]KAJ5907839.1 hypothetical protein N7495_000521 [Penicillium taxi]